MPRKVQLSKKKKKMPHLRQHKRFSFFLWLKSAAFLAFTRADANADVNLERSQAKAGVRSPCAAGPRIYSTEPCNRTLMSAVGLKALIFLRQLKYTLGSFKAEGE